MHKTIEQRKKRDKRVYLWYIDFIAKKGKAPTYREIGAHFGYSRQHAQQVMERLVEDGYLIKLPHRKWRGSYTVSVASLKEIIEKL